MNIFVFCFFFNIFKRKKKVKKKWNLSGVWTQDRWFRKPLFCHWTNRSFDFMFVVFNTTILDSIYFFFQCFDQFDTPMIFFSFLSKNVYKILLQWNKTYTCTVATIMLAQTVIYSLFVFFANAWMVEKSNNHCIEFLFYSSLF